MRKHHKKRLLKLADYLTTVRDEDLELTCWKRSCNTTACAIGHAGNITEFNELGFSCANVPQFQTKTNEVYYCWDAVNQFFGLRRHEAYYLFDKSSYREYYIDFAGQTIKLNIRKLVIERIRDFCGVPS